MGNIFTDSLLRGKIKNNYSIIEKMDEDFFGEIYKSTQIKDNELVAIKVINKEFLMNIYGDKREQCYENIRKEIDYLKKITNKYSLKLIEYVETLEFFNIVFEYYNITLEQYLIERNCGLSIKEIKLLFNKLNIAFREIVIKGIIHADINLSNIKIKIENEEIIPLLSDYGQKIILDGKLTVANSGLYFYAPELLAGELYDNKVDLWSIGVILYSLYFNEYPYNGNNQVEIYSQIEKNNLKKSKKNKEFNDLISKLLVIEPKSRINWHDYFSHNFWKIDAEEDEDYFYEEEYFGNRKFSIDNLDSKILLNMHNKKCFIYYGDNKKKNKLEKIEISFKEIISNKNFLISSLIKKTSLENLNKLILYDCNFSNIEILAKTPFDYLTELDLSNNRITNIEPLTQVSFQELTFLSLCNNKINNLEPLYQVPFINLKDLRLSFNAISNINIFSKVPFKNLNKLILNSNDITDVSVFKNPLPFENLTYLALNDNKIIDVEIYISSLKYLDLSHNQITNIKFLTSEKCKNLEILNFGKNKISNIFVFKDVLFSNMKMLYLYDNKIKDISVFSEVPFRYLKELNLSYNEIEDIDVFSEVPFTKLKKLDLVGNKIYNIGALTKIIFDENIEIYINNNEIKYGNTFNGKIINFLKEKYKYFKY